MNRREFNKSAIAGVCGLLCGKLPAVEQYPLDFPGPVVYPDDWMVHLKDHRALDDCDYVVKQLYFLDEFGYAHSCRMKGIIISLERAKLWERLSFRGHPKSPQLLVNNRLLPVSCCDMVGGPDCVLIDSGCDCNRKLLIDPVYIPLGQDKPEMDTWSVQRRRQFLLRRPSIVK
jgi:hypothetical protein